MVLEPSRSCGEARKGWITRRSPDPGSLTISAKDRPILDRSVSQLDEKNGYWFLVPNVLTWGVKLKSRVSGKSVRCATSFIEIESLFWLF